jgi:hypothetical protein
LVHAPYSLIRNCAISMTCNLLLWADIAKAAVGPFFGAGLAFLATKLHDHARTKRENMSSVRMAIAMLGEQLSDLIQFRQGIFEMIDSNAKVLGPEAPSGLCIPTPLRFQRGRKSRSQVAWLSLRAPRQRQPLRTSFQPRALPRECSAVASDLRAAAEKMQEKHGPGRSLESVAASMIYARQSVNGSAPTSLISF